MTPDMKKSRKMVDAAIKAHGGRVLDIREAGLDHAIVFEAAGRRFRLTFKSRDGRHLIHHDQDLAIDVYQLLHGYKGDRNDTEAVIAWLNQAPGLDDYDAFLLSVLRSDLQMLEGAADRG
jgi:hypothetical protein